VAIPCQGSAYHWIAIDAVRVPAYLCELIEEEINRIGKASVRRGDRLLELVGEAPGNLFVLQKGII
jgi:hypothetical protein